MMRPFTKTLLLLSLVARLRADGAAALADARGATPPTRADMELAANLKFTDWLEARSPGYAELRQGAALAGSANWIAPRLAEGRPVPQASARELAIELGESAKVPENLKRAIQAAFPPETAQFVDHRPANLAELELLKPRIEAMEKRMDMIETTMKKNVYDRGSNPQATLNMSIRYQEDVGRGLPDLGHLARHYAVISVGLSGQFPEGSYGVRLGGKYDKTTYGSGTSNDINDDIIGVAGGLITLGSWQLSLGEQDVLGLSTLTYGGVALPAASPFFNTNADIKAIGLTPSGVGPASELFHLRRIASPGRYWPFSEVQAVFSPRNQFYETWNANKLYDAAARFDAAPMSAGFMSSLKPYFTWTNTYTDEAQMRAAGFGNPVTQNNRAYALGMDMSFENGSSLLAEGAASDWLRNDLKESFSDGAAYGLVTLPLGDMTFALEGSQLGPRFITGGNDVRRSGNGQTGAYADTVMEDSERGRPKTFSYQTIVREPQAMTNNSRRAALKVEIKEAWATLGLCYSYSEQIQPSGPWVQSHFALNGLDYNGAGWFYRFGQSYALLPQGAAAPPGNQMNNQYAFAKATRAPAFAGGYAMGNTYWQEVDQVIYHETQTHILMSGRGRGDPNTLADSVKYLSGLKSTLLLDLKPLFGRDLPFDLSANNDLRDSSDQAGLSSFGETHLLAQTVSDASLRLGISQDIDLLATGGYETWLSQHSLFPVFYISRFYGAGLDFKMDELMSGMLLQLRAQRFEFEDMNFGERNHSVWGWSVGTGVSY